MPHASLENRDCQGIVERLGGAETIERSARASRAFLRPRAIGNAVDLLRLVLAYCLGPGGLRSTTAWASAIGLVDISNVGLLQRLRGSGDWLGVLVGQALSSGAPAASRFRLIRLIDATVWPQAGSAAPHRKEPVWAPHTGFA